MSFFFLACFTTCPEPLDDLVQAADEFRYLYLDEMYLDIYI